MDPMFLTGTTPSIPTPVGQKVTASPVIKISELSIQALEKMRNDNVFWQQPAVKASSPAKNNLPVPPFSFPKPNNLGNSLGLFVEENSDSFIIRRRVVTPRSINSITNTQDLKIDETVVRTNPGLSNKDEIMEEWHSSDEEEIDNDPSSSVVSDEENDEQHAPSLNEKRFKDALRMIKSASGPQLQDLLGTAVIETWAERIEGEEEEEKVDFPKEQRPELKRVLDLLPGASEKQKKIILSLGAERQAIIDAEKKAKEKTGSN